MTEYLIDVEQPGRERRTVAVDRDLEVGREVDGGLSVEDERVSRRHLRLTTTDDGLTVEDLGSTNGTFVNGDRITARTLLDAGDVVRLGSVVLQVVDGSGERPTPMTADGVATAAPSPDARTRPRAGLDELHAETTAAAVVRYRPATAGAAAAASVARDARRARRRLAGFGSEPWGVLPTICLVDPFPDPSDPTRIVTGGTIVDGARGEIWMVVTAESPPEPLDRPLALVFGSGFPGAESMGPLLEGYGLLVADTPDVDAQLQGLALPAFDSAEGELASAMAVSFVRYLVDRGGRDAFLRMLAMAEPGRVDAAAQREYGVGLAALEEGWRVKLSVGAPTVKTGQFLRLTLRYLRPHRRREAEMFVYMLFGLAFTVVFPFVVRALFDTAIPSGEFSQVLSLLAVLSAAMVVTLLAGLRQSYLSAVVSGSVVRQVRQEMFTKMQYLPQRWYAHYQQGEVLSRLFSDVALLEAGLSETLRGGAIQVLSLVVSASVLVALNAPLAIIVLAGAPVIAVVYRAMAKGALRRSLAVQEETGAVLSVAAENYGARAVVKAFGLQLREIGRFGQATDRLFDREVKLQLFGGLFGLSINMIVTVLRVLIVGIGAWLILHGHLTIGGLVAFMSLMGETLAPVTVLTGIGQQIQASTGALARINEILEAAPEVDERSDARELGPITQRLTLRDVCFSYSPERTTLSDLNVDIEAGQRVAFVGPTGAGKSSILQLLVRFYEPDEGAVLLDDVDIRDVKVASLRAQLGVVFQDTFLFNSTVRENIALGDPTATDHRIETAARAAELHDFVMTLPRGYDTLVGEGGDRLSGGQRQRLSIARALLRDPSVILLDEATSALDPRTERLIAETLERVGEGRTTIAVTHRLTSITHYDQIFVIVEGRLVEQGRHDELVDRGGTYAELWAEQTGGLPAVRSGLDEAAALAKLPLFAALDREALDAVADRLQGVTLHAGESIDDGGGRLAIIRRGHGTVLAPDFSGTPAPQVDVGPGDAFGLSALLGDATGLVLRANDALVLGVLDDETIRGLAGAHPSVGEALAGSREPDAVPAGGRRLSRLTIAPGSRVSPITTPPSADGEDIRRMTGALPAVHR